MFVIVCQIAPWDKPIKINNLSRGKFINPNEFQIGDYIIVKTGQGTDLMKIIKIDNKENELLNLKRDEGIKIEEADTETTIDSNILLRKATQADLDKVAKRNEAKNQIMEECEELIKKHKLPMKLIDIVFHFDGGRMTFAFTAPTKVDFRELVKDLAQKFHKSIRLYQVGARQEVELAGDIGPCGYSLCCLNFLKKLGNISTDLIFDQQIAHRGIDRLSGVCGRLKCCLQYEEEVYKELVKNLPPIGSQVKTSRGEGKVVDYHILKQTVMVEIDKDTVIEVPVQEINKL